MLKYLSHYKSVAIKQFYTITLNFIYYYIFSLIQSYVLDCCWSYYRWLSRL